MATKTTAKPKSKMNGVLPSPADVLTLAEAAAFLRVPEAGLKADAEAGRVPGRTVGGEWRFSQHGLIAWLGTPAEVVKRNRPAGGVGRDYHEEDPEQVIADIYRERKKTPVGG